MTLVSPQFRQTVPSTQEWPVAVSHKLNNVETDLSGFTHYASAKAARYGASEPGDDFTASEWRAVGTMTVGDKFYAVVPTGPEYGALALAVGVWHLFIGIDAVSMNLKPVLYAGAIEIK
jgi:hypothetical protein